MSGTATLTRPPTATPLRRPAVLARPPRVATLRGALVAATFAAACLTVSYARELVLSYGGSIRTLGSVAHYAYSVPTLLGWLLAAAALCLGYLAATELGATRATRVGFLVAMIGTILFALAGACAVWATEIQDHASTSGGALSVIKATSVTNEVLELSKAELAFQAAGLLVLAIAACVAWSARPRVAWRRVLVALGVGFAVGAVAPAYAFVHVIRWVASAPNQADVLLTTVPTVLSWLAIALALFLAAAALRRSPRTEHLAVAAIVAAVGASVLAVAYGTQVLLAQFELSGTHFSWFANLARTSATTTWAGWLLLTAGVGIAAVRLLERRVLARPDVPLPRG
jgi:hypothetical protein